MVSPYHGGRARCFPNSAGEPKVLGLVGASRRFVIVVVTGGWCVGQIAMQKATRVAIAPPRLPEVANCDMGRRRGAGKGAWLALTIIETKNLIQSFIQSVLTYLYINLYLYPINPIKHKLINKKIYNNNI